MVLALTAQALTRWGYTILAADGIEALEIFTAHPEPIHLLFTDVVMPRMGGRELSESCGARALT